MKQSLKQRINNLDPKVREKLIKKLARERLLKKLQKQS